MCNKDCPGTWHAHCKCGGVATDRGWARVDGTTRGLGKRQRLWPLWLCTVCMAEFAVCHFGYGSQTEVRVVVTRHPTRVAA
jgi:hypothetical protein